MATATVKSRKAGSGTGSAWAQYTDELATASTTADTKAGEPQYVTTTFTVPADAAPEGALWLSFSDMGLADDANGYIDDVVLVRSDSKSTLKITAFTPIVAEGGTVSAYVELDGQPAAKEVSANKNATVELIKVAAKPAKTEYTVGDTFSADGLKVVKVMSDKTEPERSLARRSLPVSRTSVQDRCLGGWRGRFACLSARRNDDRAHLRTQTEPFAFLCSRTCRFDAHIGTQTGRTCCCCVAAPSSRCAVTMSLPSGERRKTRNGPAANHATGPFLNAGPRRLNP